MAQNDGTIFAAGGSKSSGIIESYDENMDRLISHKIIQGEYVRRIRSVSDASHLMYSTWNGSIGIIGLDLAMIRRIGLLAPALAMDSIRNKMYFGNHEGLSVVKSVIGTMERNYTGIVHGKDEENSPLLQGANSSLFTRMFFRYSVW